MRHLFRVFWLIVDQGIFASSNFVLNVCFVRWLTPQDYGVFAISFTGYLFMSVVHWGGFLEPLLVLSGQIEQTRRRSYIVTLAVAHGLMIAAIAAICLIGFTTAVLLGHPATGWAMLGAGIGGSLMLSLITARRLCLAFLSPRVSALIGVIYFAGVLASAYGLSMQRVYLSWFDLWEIMGGWSLLCAVLIFILLYVRTTGSEPYSLRTMLHFQGTYAPGAIAAASCNWVAFDGVFIMLSSMVGLTAVAETKAIFTLLNPLANINAAMHASWLVMFSEQREKTQRVLRIIRFYMAAIFFCVSVLYFTATPLVRVFYGGRYLDVAWELPLFVTALGCFSISLILTSLFKARGGLWQGFAPDVIGALSAICVGFVTIRLYGQTGAVYAILCGYVVNLSLATAIYLLAYPQQVKPLKPPKQPATKRCLKMKELT